MFAARAIQRYSEIGGQFGSRVSPVGNGFAFKKKPNSMTRIGLLASSSARQERGPLPRLRDEKAGLSPGVCRRRARERDMLTRLIHDVGGFGLADVA